MCNEMIRAFRTQDINLCLLISNIGIRAEAVKVQCEPRVRRATCCEGQRNFTPIVVDMTPKNCSPFMIELVKSLISAAQPGLELLRAGGTIAAITEFIVNLPANDCRMIAIMLSHFGYNALSIFMVK